MLIGLVSILMILPLGGNNAPAPLYNARPPQPIGSLPALFGTEDYPAEALGQSAEGSTGYRIQVSAIGRVEKCDIERSSGRADLDQATCQVITRRSRFYPALDVAGRPVASIYSGTIHWMLGEGPAAGAKEPLGRSRSGELHIAIRLT